MKTKPSILVRKKMRLRSAKEFDTIPITEQPSEASTEKWMLQMDSVEKNPADLSQIGAFQHIGSRSEQQDSYGYCRWEGGCLAILADGMGGLQAGEQVSSLLVESFIRDSAALVRERCENALLSLLKQGNLNVNRMLGQENLYKSGSTVIAVLIEKGAFQWISVGDSHIYLYRNNSIFRLNREHIYKKQLMLHAVNGKIPLSEVEEHAERDSLTSFVGMGELRYIDASEEKLPCGFGDRLLLVSDGVYNALSDEELCELLGTGECAEATAKRIGEAVLAKRIAEQDNLTAIVVELD